MRLRKYFRPFLLTLLAAAMMCSLALPASASVLQTGSRPFNDVVRNSWYYNYVYSAYDQGVFAGLDNHTFGTQTSMTRGMMVTVLYGMAGKPSTKTSVPFTDVEPSRYYAGPVAWAYKNGIVQGLSETVFAPDMNISREQTALILEKYAASNGINLTYRKDLKDFEDAGDVSDWAEEALRWAVENKIMAGKGKDLLKPADTSTRAEMATMLMAYRVRYQNGKVNDYNPYLYTDSVLQGYSTARNDYWFGTNYDGKNRPSESVRFQSVYGDKFNTLAVGSADYKTIYLTFDEGYENGYTSAILDTLKKKNVRAVFFVTLPYVKENPQLVQRMIREGHVVGSHSSAHPSDGMQSLGLNGAKSDLEQVQNEVRNRFGYEMTLFRFPAGIYSEQMLALCKSMGLRSVFWSFAHADWDPASQPARASSLQKLKERLHPGAVYLLHAVSATNTAILGDFIDYAQSQGYYFQLITNE